MTMYQMMLCKYSITHKLVTKSQSKLCKYSIDYKYANTNFL